MIALNFLCVKAMQRGSVMQKDISRVAVTFLVFLVTGTIIDV